MTPAFIENETPPKHRGIRPIKRVLKKALRQNVFDYGGVSHIMSILQQNGFFELMNKEVCILKRPSDYKDHDHILAIALSHFCGGRTLDDIDMLRGSKPAVRMLGADRIPDPTTAGDFCRRLSEEQINKLMDTLNTLRFAEIKRAGLAKGTARIDADGTFVTTDSETAQGVDYTYKGGWGYHPLIVSLANVKDLLFIVNRPGNRPSHEGAVKYLTKAAALCLSAGFTKVIMRGDTDFSQTAFLDDWHKQGYCFVFGIDAMKNLKELAGKISNEKWTRLQRDVSVVDFDDERQKGPRVKDLMVEKHGFEKLTLDHEEVCEIPYSPTACKRTYRLVIVKKVINVTKGKETLPQRIRYFFYLTNLRRKEFNTRAIVEEANNRCNQENLHAQLKDGLRALRAPLKTLEANWAYMVIASLAWTFKTWIALRLQHKQSDLRESVVAMREMLLAMEFRKFFNQIVKISARIIEKGRRVIIEFLKSTPLSDFVHAHSEQYS